MVPPARSKEYIKGPDVMSKSARTQRRHRAAWVGQTRLDQFIKRNTTGTNANTTGTNANTTGTDTNTTGTYTDTMGTNMNTNMMEMDSNTNTTETTTNMTATLVRTNDAAPEGQEVIHLDSSESEDDRSLRATLPVIQRRKPLARRASGSPEFSSDHGDLPPGSNLGSDDGRSPSCDNSVAISAAISDTEAFSAMNAAGDESGDDDTEEIQQIEKEIEAMVDLGEADGEAWEDEIDENTMNPQMELCPWDVLRAKIKDEVKKKQKILSISHLNQLMILANFATLRLKGLSRMAASAEIAHQWHEGNGIWFARRVRNLARHYQIFEQLPKERCGGLRMGRSWLHDEAVRSHVQQFLRSVPTGKVTSNALAKHVNGVIFPELGITPAKPVSIRTSRRWLIKLGWRHTRVKKGVYMDGHEREDVIAYRNEVFLPAMAKFEARMVQYDGPDMKPIKPKLAPGEKEIIPQFHDECCFHANDQASYAW